MPTLTVNKTKVELALGAPFLELDEIDPTLVPFGCRAAACGSCVMRVIKGAECMGRREAAESRALEIFGYPQEEYRLACRSRLMGDVEVEPVNA